MKVVYHCYGGAHASPVAAAIHTGALALGRVPTGPEIQALPLFDRVDPKDYGRLVRVGATAEKDDVFVLGCGKYKEIMLKALEGLTELLGEEPDQYLLADVFPCINLPMRIGGFISRVLGITRLGRPIVTWGVRRAYPRLCTLVMDTKARLAETKLAREGRQKEAGR